MTETKSLQGKVVRVKRGSQIRKASKGYCSATTTIRKERIVVVEFADNERIYFKDYRSQGWWAEHGTYEIVSDDDHTLHVTREKLGGYPIAGWNWPMWGYNYRCACGDTAIADREDHRNHLLDLAEGNYNGHQDS